MRSSWTSKFQAGRPLSDPWSGSRLSDEERSSGYSFGHLTHALATAFAPIWLDRSRLGRPASDRRAALAARSIGSHVTSNPDVQEEKAIAKTKVQTSPGIPGPASRNGLPCRTAWTAYCLPMSSGVSHPVTIDVYVSPLDLNRTSA